MTTTSQTKLDLAKVDEILESYEYKKSNLIAILQKIQEIYRYLPIEAMTYVGTKIEDLSPATVYGVATFYAQFSLEPKGKYEIRVCDGTACHVRKSADIQQAFYDSTGMTPDDSMSSDGLFSIERVACLGACGLAPVCMVNDIVHAQMTPKEARRLIAELREAEKDEA